MTGWAGMCGSLREDEHQEYLRQVVCQAAESGLPVPGLMVSLGYLDAYRSAWLPANLKAQRLGPPPETRAGLVRPLPGPKHARHFFDHRGGPR